MRVIISTVFMHFIQRKLQYSVEGVQYQFIVNDLLILNISNTHLNQGLEDLTNLCQVPLTEVSSVRMEECSDLSYNINSLRTLESNIIKG